MPQMPQSVKNYGVTVKKALAFPLLVISVKSPNGTYDSNFLSNYTTININDAIARIPGVGQINLFGGSDYAMRVWLRPDRIGAARHHRSRHRQRHQPAEPADARPARSAGRRPRPAPSTPTPSARRAACSTRRSSATSSSAPIPTAREVRLKDVARLELGTMLYNAVGRHDGKPAAVIAVFQIPGTNALDVAEQHQGDDGRSDEALPARHGLPGLARHDAAGHRRASTRSSTRCSKRSRSSSSSCSSSCRTGARR